MSSDHAHDEPDGGAAEQPTLVYGRPVGSGLPHIFSEHEIVAARYRIVRFIAAVGMGEVYEAEDLELQERIAIKTVRAEITTPDALERLKREIQLARRVTHPNVCRTYDIYHHRAPGGATITFVTMELLRGTTLARYLRERTQLSTAEALPIVRQICAGLAAAHRAGVIHRDLKTENIVLAGEGEAMRVVIMDFGLARFTGPDAIDQSLTMPGAIVGTAAYLAPEQLSGSEITPATDIYALGVVLYEMVTGARPYRGGDSIVAMLAQKLHDPPSSPRQFAPELDRRWEAAILRCLERDPSHRFASAAEVVDALTGDAPVPLHSARRNRGVLAVAGILMLVAIGGGVLQYRASRAELVQPPQPRVVRIVPRTSVAVLGFRNTTGRGDADWLSTALAEMLTTELAAEGRLRAIPGEEIQRAKIELDLADASAYAPATLQRIHRNLGADVIVFGSYVALGGDRGGQIRVDVRVQHANSGALESVIAETGTEAKLFELVSRIGERMRTALGVQVTATPQSTMPADPAVAKLYVEGLDALRTFEALRARDLLERAAEKDPEQPLIRAALAQAWSALGYDRRARESARRAFELSSKLPREQRLLIEAGYRETIGDWRRAADIYRALTSFFPDNLEYVLRLANAQTKHGDANGALATVGYLRRFPEPLRSDPRIDLAEVEAANALQNYPRMQEAAERAIAKGEERGARLLVARARSSQGVALHRQGRTSEGLASQERALAIWRDAGDRGGVARSLVRIGSVYIYLGEIGTARRYFVDALDIAGASGDTWVQLAAWNNLAFCSFMAGDAREAEELLRRMLALARELGDRKIEATAFDNIGFAQLLRGELDAAASSFQASFGLAREIGSQQVMAVAQTNVGDVLLARGQTAQAREEYEQALAVRETIGEKRGVAESRIALANVAIEENRGADAEKLARAALSWATGARVWDAEALARNALARALLLQRRVGEARREIEAAAKLAESHENQLVSIAVGVTRARVAAAEGKLAEAQQHAAEAVRRASRGSLVQPRLEAELARAEVADAAQRPALLARVARDAAARGFLLIAKKAR